MQNDTCDKFLDSCKRAELNSTLLAPFHGGLEVGQGDTSRAKRSRILQIREHVWFWGTCWNDVCCRFSRESRREKRLIFFVIHLWKWKRSDGIVFFVGFFFKILGQKSNVARFLLWTLESSRIRWIKNEDFSVYCNHPVFKYYVVWRGSTAGLCKQI